MRGKCRFSHHAANSQPLHVEVGLGTRTLGSAREPGVWAWIIRCTNFIQHIRTPGAAVSILRRILDLIATIVCQEEASFGVMILRNKWHQNYVFQEIYLEYARDVWYGMRAESHGAETHSDPFRS